MPDPHPHLDAEFLSAYVDGAVTDEEHARIEQHLERCSSCRVELESLRWTVDLMGHLPEESPPRTFYITEAMVEPEKGRPEGGWSLTGWRELAATLTAVAAIMVCVILVASPISFPGAAPAPMADMESAAPEASEPEIAAEPAPREESETMSQSRRSTLESEKMEQPANETEQASPEEEAATAAEDSMETPGEEESAAGEAPVEEEMGADGASAEADEPHADPELGTGGPSEEESAEIAERDDTESEYGVGGGEAMPAPGGGEDAPGTPPETEEGSTDDMAVATEDDAGPYPPPEGYPLSGDYPSQAPDRPPEGSSDSEFPAPDVYPKPRSGETSPDEQEMYPPSGSAGQTQESAAARALPLLLGSLFLLVLAFVVWRYQRKNP